jgi:hypothetical protein
MLRLVYSGSVSFVLERWRLNRYFYGPGRFSLAAVNLGRPHFNKMGTTNKMNKTRNS